MHGDTAELAWWANRGYFAAELSSPIDPLRSFFFFLPSVGHSVCSELKKSRNLGKRSLDKKLHLSAIYQKRSYCQILSLDNMGISTKMSLCTPLPLCEEVFMEELSCCCSEQSWCLCFHLFKKGFLVVLPSLGRASGSHQQPFSCL